MELRVWQSFSCNNSSSYYLVARFESAAKAEEVSAEVREFLAKHAEQKDEILDENLDDWENAMAQETEAQKSLAERHGFDWQDQIFWGDSELAGDEPIVSTVGDKLFVYHGYCGGGLEFLDPLISACGGSDSHGDMTEPMLNVIIRLTDDEHGSAIRETLTQFFSQQGSTEYMDQWSGEAFGVSNPPHTDNEELLVWSDAGHTGFSMRVDEETLAGIRKLADGPGVVDIRMTLEDEVMRDTLRRLIGAKLCPECESDLRYIPAGDSVAEDQLACNSCGGMFALSAMQVPDDQ